MKRDTWTLVVIGLMVLMNISSALLLRRWQHQAKDAIAAEQIHAFHLERQLSECEEALRICLEIPR